MSPPLHVTAYTGSDVGLVRDGNEDNLFAGATVFAVADGMGGHNAGEVASKMALEPIRALDGQTFDDARAATEALEAAVEAANGAVMREASSNPRHAGMGTTLTAVLVRDGALHLAHVGDSRAYLLRRAEGMDQLTVDHTLVEQLVQDGRLSRDEIATHPQRSVITRAIGVDDDIDVDTLGPLVLQPGDQILVCSDGLTGPVDDRAIADVLTATPDGEDAVRDLLALANDRGGPDNITVVLLRVDGDGHGAGDDGQVTAGLPADPPRPSIAIRTRPESASHDWAADMGRYGDRATAPRRGPKPPSRVGRVLAFLTGVVILLAVLGAGGWLLLSRAFFIGASDDGRVAIYNGLPQEVAGVALYRVRETTDVVVADLPPRRQERIRAGINVADMTEARAAVAEYRSQAGRAAAPAGTPSESPSP